MSDAETSTQRRKLPWRKMLIAGVAIVGLLVLANYWTFRPTLIMQDFVRRVLSSQFDDAAKMVSTPGTIITTTDSCTLTAADGSSCAVPTGKAEFHVLDEPGRMARAGIADYLLGRQRFQLCAIWEDESGVSHVSPIYCTTQRSAVVIDHVGVVGIAKSAHHNF